MDTPQIDGDNARYDASFYGEQLDGSLRSARVILTRLFEIYRPSSVVDVGCGRGAWLSMAGALGSTELRGFDGSWVKKDELVDHRIHFTQVDLETDLRFEKRYELCISVEVAEHLRNSRAAGFIRDLCAASDIVLFGAAVPGQGGTNHINERWQTYWEREFDTNGFECHDIFRGWAWRNSAIDWWYRQNAFLFTNRSAKHLNIDRDSLTRMQHSARDLVHPELFEIKQQRLREVYEDKLLRLQRSHEKQLSQPTLRLILDLSRGYVGRRIRRLWGRLDD